MLHSLYKTPRFFKDNLLIAAAYAGRRIACASIAIFFQKIQRRLISLHGRRISRLLPLTDIILERSHDIGNVRSGRIILSGNMLQCGKNPVVRVLPDMSPYTALETIVS